MSFILPSVRVLSMWKRMGDTSVFKCSGFLGSIPFTERALTVLVVVFLRPDCLWHLRVCFNSFLKLLFGYFACGQPAWLVNALTLA